MCLVTETPLIGWRLLANRDCMDGIVLACSLRVMLTSMHCSVAIERRKENLLKHNLSIFLSYACCLLRKTVECFSFKFVCS